MKNFLKWSGLQYALLPFLIWEVLSERHGPEVDSDVDTSSIEGRTTAEVETSIKSSPSFLETMAAQAISKFHWGSLGIPRVPRLLREPQGIPGNPVGNPAGEPWGPWGRPGRTVKLTWRRAIVTYGRFPRSEHRELRGRAKQT